MIKITLNITNTKNYNEAVKKRKFERATDVWLYNLPEVKELPAMPLATDVWLDNLPEVKELPAMPMAKVVRLYNLLKKLFKKG